MSAPNPDRVIETLHDSGLDLDACVVIGGAVLALNNIRSAHDIDLVVHPSLFGELTEAGKLPNGVPLRRKTAGIIDYRLLSKDPSSQHLTLDLNSISGYHNYRNFDNFKQQYSEVSTYGGVLIRHALLTELENEKSHSWRPKDHLDIRRIRKRQRQLLATNR